MKKKFVNIEIKGEGQIGVIDLGVIDVLKDGETKTCNVIRQRLEPKLVEALSSHFDCTVKIRMTNVISSVGAIEVNVDVIIESEEQDYEEEVKLLETWVY